MKTIRNISVQYELCFLKGFRATVISCIYLLSETWLLYYTNGGWLSKPLEAFIH